MLAAGLTRGAFYAHFKSTDELFTEIVVAGTGDDRPCKQPPGPVDLERQQDRAFFVQCHRDLRIAFDLRQARGEFTHILRARIGRAIGLLVDWRGLRTR